MQPRSSARYRRLPKSPQRIVLGAVASLFLVASTACGNLVPLPVPPTPEANLSTSAEAPPPPTPVVDAHEVDGVCSQHDQAPIARFIGHYTASDGLHYHGWQLGTGEKFWVVC